MKYLLRSPGVCAVGLDFKPKSRRSSGGKQASVKCVSSFLSRADGADILCKPHGYTFYIKLLKNIYIFLVLHDYQCMRPMPQNSLFLSFNERFYNPFAQNSGLG